MITRSNMKKTADSLSISFNTIIIVPKKRKKSRYNSTRQSIVSNFGNKVIHKKGAKKDRNWYDSFISSPSFDLCCFEAMMLDIRNIKQMIKTT